MEPVKEGYDLKSSYNWIDWDGASDGQWWVEAYPQNKNH